LSRQTPPTDAPRSKIVMSSKPERFSSIAAASPPNPHPTMTTEACLPVRVRTMVPSDDLMPMSAHFL
jgi:hypothetical protein